MTSSLLLQEILMSAHTVTLAAGGSTLVLRGAEVNTCSSAGFVRHASWEKVTAFFGLGDENCQMQESLVRRTVQTAPKVFERGYTLTIAPMERDSAGVWFVNDDRALQGTVTVVNDYR